MDNPLRASVVPGREILHAGNLGEVNAFSERERVALEWTEAATRLSNDLTADELYQRLCGRFDEKTLQS